MTMTTFLKGFGAWALARLREPSTYAGLAGLVGTLSFLPHAAELAALIPQIGVGIVGLLSLAAIVVPERKQ